MSHLHKAKKIRTICFQGPVSADENPAAHGGVCEIETCLCGAERHTNVNGIHIETGAWHGDVIADEIDTAISAAIENIPDGIPRLARYRIIKQIIEREYYAAQSRYPRD